MGNRKLQFAVMRLQFHVVGISNFFQGVHCLVPPCCFSSSQTESLLSPKKQG